MILTKRINLFGLAIGLVLVSLPVSSVALAQTETVAVSADVPKELVSLAQDLGCQTKVECAEKFDANIEQGIALAQKYDIYTPEQEKVAATFKTEVLERLRGVSQDNFEEEILVLANKILKEKPALARTISLTRQTVNAAETIINTVKEAGVDIRVCQKSPEDLSREQLIACVKAGNNLSSKEKTAGDYIPKGNVKAEEAGRMLDLEDSLLAGEYSSLGKINAEEAGRICLKPGSESIADCDQIAQKFFGNEGVKQLQEARQQTTRIKEYYTKGIEKMELVTPDGQKLIGKGAIKNACDLAFEKNNLGLARACGNFAVKNGYASQEEIESGLKLLESFSQKAGNVNFDDCRFNPESCREFLPDEFRPQFDSQFEIFRIMSESIGFDPARCENSYDPDIGKRCLEGAKKALSRVEEIAKNSPEARRIVDEIRGHIAEGERMTEKLGEFHQDSDRGGNAGPGGCRGPEECFKYCTQPGNSAECISFGAKSQIFDRDTAAQKFNMVNERFNTLPGQYPGFTEPGKGDYRSYPNGPDYSDRSRQQPGFDQYPQYPYPYPPQQPVGPSPECFAAVSSGDFTKAKIACSSTTENYPKPIAEPFPVCPAYSMPSPCPEGQMRQAASDAKGCVAYGACTVIENYKPIDTTPKSCPSGQYWDGRSCVAQPTTQCSSGQWWDPATQACRSSTVPMVGSCDYSTQYWKASTSQCQPRTNCYDTANSEYNSQECQGVRGSTTVSYGCGSLTTQATCQASPGCGWANGACGGNTSTVPDPTYSSCPANIKTLLGDGCHSMSVGYFNSGMTSYVLFGSTAVNNCSTSSVTGCSGNTTTTTCPTGQWWNGTACTSSTSTSTSTTSQCSPGQYWYTPPGGGAGYCTGNPSSSGACPAGYHPHGESGGFCMNDQENYSGTCYNSAGTSTITCPQQTYTPPASGCSSGQYWYTPPGGGAGYCQSSSTTTCPSNQWWDSSTGACRDNSSACAQAGGTWNSSTNYCQMPTCPSGQYWFTPSGGGAGYCMSNTTSTTTCASGQYWNGSSCASSSTTSSDGATACAQAGGTWNSSMTPPCQMPNTTTSGASSCSSGQYWNGSACVSSTPSTYTSPSYTPPSDTSTYTSPPTYTPPSDTSGTYTSPPSYTPPPDTSTYTPPPSAMILCSQTGGNWTGAACNLAKNISDQKAYLSYFQKDSDGLLAQVFGAFADLFR